MYALHVDVRVERMNDLCKQTIYFPISTINVKLWLDGIAHKVDIKNIFLLRYRYSVILLDVSSKLEKLRFPINRVSH